METFDNSKKVQVAINMDSSLYARLSRCAARVDVPVSVWARVQLAEAAEKVLAPLEKEERRIAREEEARRVREMRWQRQAVREQMGMAKMGQTTARRAMRDEAATAKELKELSSITMSRMLGLRMMPQHREIVKGSFGIHPVKFVAKGEEALEGDYPAMEQDVEYLKGKMFYHDAYINADYCLLLREKTGLVLGRPDPIVPRNVWDRLADLWAPRTVNVLGRSIIVKAWSPTGDIFWYDPERQFWMPTDGKTGLELLDLIDHHYKMAPGWDAAVYAMKSRAFKDIIYQQPSWSD